MSYMLISEPNTFRNNVREMFKRILNEKHATNLEIGIYNYTIQQCKYKKIIRKWENKLFVQIYIDRFRTIWRNLSDPLNDLISRIESEELLPQNLSSTMTHQEMNPEKWKQLINDKIKRDSIKYTEDMRMATDEFKCGRCKERKCSYYQLQTRSADEPMTTFVTCLNCGKNWKF
jgi:transcription elongation factor S-II